MRALRLWPSPPIELVRFDETWGATCPMITTAWREHWPHVTPFLALPDGLRRAVYTTNTIAASRPVTRPRVAAMMCGTMDASLVTVLFTDIVGSTSLYDRLGDDEADGRASRVPCS